MAKVIIDKRRCKGCGLCVEFCPAKIIVLDKKITRSGVHTAIVKNISKCKKCGICAIVCPDWAIEVK